MGNFRKWLNHRGYLEGIEDAADRFRFSDDHIGGRDYEKDFQELVKVIMSKYNTEFLRFTTELSDQRGDQEVRDLLRRVQVDRKDTVDDWKPKHPKEPEQVVTPKADRGHDPNQVS